MPSRLRSSLLTASLLTVSTLGVPASGFGQECAGTGGPAATLLVPYFEVDLDQPSGRTTLFSVANAGPEATVARVVLWTNLGIPTLAFDVLVRADGVVSVNLRDVFAGALPMTGAEPWEKPESCDAPLALPDLSGTSLADLRARHTGLPSSDGLCYGAPQGDGLTSGYVTVDVMSGCLPEGRVPGDGKPYFAGEGGLAGEDNVLWGDVFLIDAAGHRAEGLRAVPIPADPTLEGGRTFYSGVVDGGLDRRRRLPDFHRTRFLDGPDSHTDLIVWSGHTGFNKVPLPPHEGLCLESAAADPTYTVRGWNETADESFVGGFMTSRHSLRLAVGSEELPTSIPFGTLELESFIYCHICSPPYGGPLQAWVGTLSGAQGRYAVGLEAVGLGPCP